MNKNNTLCVSVPLWQKNLIIFQLDVHTISREANGVKKLPIGIQTFSEIISENYYYVDKTKILSELTEKGKYYFLSRPRRFGKSLFLDTIKEAFEGNEKLFQGLYLEHNWNWSKKHPVIRIDFGGGVLRNAEELEQRIREILRSNAKRHQIDKIENSSVSGTFEELIQILSQKYSQKVVVLVDEYDKPILDNITNKNVARDMRDGLRNLYSAI
ncbi:MAG: AAA family ATPase, partial [Leptospiraceae bacterium]|nr:AAA family ATPase [Leptospiraceae bacterium]